MKRIVPWLVMLSLVAEAGPPLARSSPIAITNDGTIVVTANADSDSISALDMTSGSVTEIAVGGNPQTVALSPDGVLAYVANRDDHTLAIVPLHGRPPVVTVRTCRHPFGVVSDDQRVFVSCFGDAKIAVHDRESLELTGTIDVARDPRGLALSADRTKLYVSHFTTGQLTVIDIETAAVDRVVTTLAESNLAQSIFIDGSTELAYLPQTRSNALNPALLFDTTVFPIVSVVDLRTGTNVASKRIAIDVADRPSGIPIDAVVSANRLFVLHAASNDLSVIDLATGRGIAHLNVGANPRGLVLSTDQKRLYVNNALDGSVTVIDASTLQVERTVAVTTIPLPARILNGKRLFNSSADPRLARDRWIACSTCHFDGGMDRRTWFFRDGPRNTPALAAIEHAGPFHWSGDLDELHDVENTIRIIQAGTGLTDGTSNCLPSCDQGPPNGGRSNDLDDLVAFMKSLQLARRTVSYSESSLRGRDIFFSSATRCAACHPPPLFTDRRRHDVGTANGASERKGTFLDTPTLVDLVDTAPYLHDGSAPTLLEVLLAPTRQGTAHGHVSHLSEQDLRDLVAFLETITSPVRRRAVRR